MEMMTILNKHNSFYVGSCRYMKFFHNYFPAKLHTTKEIINYLKNYDNIDLNTENVNYMYGDILQPEALNESIEYCENMNNIFDDISNVFLEITSRKYILDDGKIYNNFYFNPKNDKPISKINDDELYNDLLTIKYLLKKKFDIESIYVIPHIDLMLDNGEYIKGRKDLKESLKCMTKMLGIEFVNINDAFSQNAYFKNIAPDTLHFSKYGNFKVFSYLKEYLNL